MQLKKNVNKFIDVFFKLNQEISRCTRNDAKRVLGA